MKLHSSAYPWVVDPRLSKNKKFAYGVIRNSKTVKETVPLTEADKIKIAVLALVEREEGVNFIDVEGIGRTTGYRWGRKRMGDGKRHPLYRLMDDPSEVAE